MKTRQITHIQVRELRNAVGNPLGMLKAQITTVEKKCIFKSHDSFLNQTQVSMGNVSTIAFGQAAYEIRDLAGVLTGAF